MLKLLKSPFPLFRRRKPITDPRRMLPIHTMVWSRDDFGRLSAMAETRFAEDDETRTYNEASFDVPF